MAVFDKQSKMLEILPQGMNPSAADKGASWIQNMEKQQGSWQTRAGFGTIAILDSQMTTGKEVVDGFPVGLQRHLGSHMLTNTNFGHKQVISIFRSNVYTSDYLNNQSTSITLSKQITQYRTIYTAFIYDITTDDYFEVPLMERTSQTTNLLSDRHAGLETSIGTRLGMDYQSWIDAGQNEEGDNREFNTDDEEYFWFAETKDAATRNILVFGNARAGVWGYSPIDPRNSVRSYGQRRMSINAAYTQDFKEPYGEVSCIFPIVGKDGLFVVDGFTYLTEFELGKPQAACTLDRRMVYAVDNVLYFSDPEDLNSIVDANIQGFPARITAVAPTLGNLLVWTEDNKTYYYNPAQGDIISGGRTTCISDSIGCLGPNAWTNVDGAIIWADKSGFYKNYGNTTVSKISDPLDIFFQKGVSNSLINYYTESGATIGTDPQPFTFYDWNATTQVGVNITYEPKHGQILFTIPKLLLTFVLEDNGYHVWNYQSIVSDDGSVPVVNGVNNIPNPWLLTDVGEIYIVSDVRTQSPVDTTVIMEAATGYNTQEHSFAILKQGRGGALDASLDSQFEDRRWFTGEFRNSLINEETSSADFRDHATFYINQPIAIPAGYSMYWGGTTVADTDYSPMWVPIELVPYKNDITLAPYTPANITEWYLEFKFDNTHWQPYINQNGINNYEAIWNLPSERLGAVGAYFLQNADDTADQGVWVYDSVNAIPSATGDTIKMHIFGAAGSHTTSPEFGFIPHHRNPVIMLPFKRKTTNGSADTMSMGIEPIIAWHTSAAQAERGVQCIVWDDQIKGMRTTWAEYESTQAVDWCLTSPEVHSDEAGFMLKARGINIEIESSGNATLQAADPGAAIWPIRLFNVLTTTNYKLYAVQLLDFITDPVGLIKVAKNAIRNRIGTSAIQTTATFANTTAQGPVWGDFNDTTAGNLLIGDEQYDNIKTSNGVKGDRIEVQMMGHVMSPAEKVRIGMAKLFVRLLPGLRRRGR
jgi:hypothetical protein